jgi:flavin-dependent dehydrogenase
LTTISKYDVAIIGGGIAGLSLAIQLGAGGYEVIVLEKESYPFHKVCGEYISLESWNFLENLGYPLSDMDLPIITNLLVSAPNGNAVKEPLFPGGFGISRYKIDAGLAELARRNSVTIMENTKVTDLVFEDNLFRLQTITGHLLQARVAVGCFGKRSNLDVKWKRKFIEQRSGKPQQYIGVKYHIRTGFPADTIALHNFPGGYCGLSAIENGNYCLCYLTRALNLQLAGNSIAAMEEQFLFQNPLLKNIFTSAEMLWTAPLTIAQISFEKKSQAENHVLLMGDAAGMISPLCGNGMSMALHAGKIAAPLIMQFLQGQLTRTQMEEQYVLQWKQAFRKRVRAGRLIQGLFGKPLLTNGFIGAIKPFPKAIAWLVSRTHGEAF